MINQGCAEALPSMKLRRKRQLYQTPRGKPTARQAAPPQRGFGRGVDALRGGTRALALTTWNGASYARTCP
jgi:hypothetical protein